MESLKTETKEKEQIAIPLEKKSTKKIKQKKKSKKIKPEKHYKNLKELLNDIKPEPKVTNEEEEDILLKDNFSIYHKSTSETTVGSLSLEGNDYYTKRNSFELKLNSNYAKKNFCEFDENGFKDENDFFSYKNKNICSPIFEYYEGTNDFLKKELINENNDIKKSKNFLEKSKVLNNNSDKEKIEIKEKKEINLSIYNNSKNGNKFNIEFNMDNNNMNYPIYNYMNFYNYEYNNNFYYNNNNKNNDIQKIINNINNNINKNYYLFPYNKKNNNKKGNKSKRTKGEWTCEYCFNLNYSFRKSCNRCNALK